jgi:hypothetical protein
MRRPLPGLLLAAALASGGAHAQARLDHEAPARYGALRLSEGFAPDPRTVMVQAGGADDASAAAPGCVGFVDAAAPDATVDYAAGRSPLAFLARAERDTALVVRDPTGAWTCDDDTDGQDPRVRFDAPPSGVYAVWVAVVGDAALAPARLSVTELAGTGTGAGTGAAGGVAGAPPPDAARSPTYGTLRLSAGFEDDPRRLELEAGGGLDASGIGQECVGFIAEDAADVVIDYRAGDLPLRIYVEAEADTTLVVRTPSGAWACNDDDDDVNPGILFERPESGAYAVWVGTYEPGPTVPATLLVSEAAPVRQGRGAPADLAWDAEPTYGTLRLSAGFDDDPRTLEVRAGGPDAAAGLGDACAGFIASDAPDAAVEYEAGGYPLGFYVRSDADTTLVVRTPGGEILCDDDTDDADPVVSIAEPESGRYAVWVGTFADGPTQDATLHVTELETREGGAGGEPDWRAQPTYGTLELRAGFRPDPRTVEVRAGGDGDASGLGDGCVGAIDFSAPDVDVNYEGGGDVLYISATSQADTTLVVYTPSQEWVCNDDFDGSDPGIVFRGPESGNYNIWVGTFSAGPTQPATLRVSGRDPRRK